MRKLVRDHIPAIIAADTGPVEYERRRFQLDELLRDKLQEEVAEYLKSLDPAELADIFEVIRALARQKGWTEDDLLAVARGKRVLRGGFTQGFVIDV